MGIEVDDNGNGQQSQQRPAASMSETFARNEQQAQGRQGAKMSQEQGRTGFSFRNLGRALHTSIARTPMSEVLSKLEKKFAEIYQPYGNALVIKLIALDVNVVTEIAASVLVVAAQLKNISGEAFVAYHTLILDGTGGEYQPRFENYQGANVQIDRFASDIWDKKMKEFVQGEVARQFGTTNLVEMDATVIPRDFDLENDTLVRLVAANSLIACDTQLESSLKGFQDINLADAQSDSLLTTKILFNDQETYNIVGKPVRADINIIMSASGTQQAQNPDRLTEVSKLSGFLDLAYAPVAPANNPFANFGQVQPQATQLYAAQFIITNMETAQLQTIPAQLLALVQAMMLRQDNAWAQGFRPRPYQGEIDIHDIGALGYEAGPERDENGNGKRVETKGDRFRPETFAALLQMWIQPGLSVALDVSEAGPDSAFNGVFAAASQGSAAANKAVIDGAMTLTNGLFEKNYRALNGSGRIADWKENRVHQGTYRAPNGKLRSLSDIGYIEVMNLVGEKDLSIVTEWSNSWLALTVPRFVREATRKRILSKLLVDPVFEGFAIRAMFEAAFLQALAQSCHEAGLSLKPQFPYSDFTAHERATAQFAGSMLSGQATTGLFSGGYGSVGSNAGSSYRTNSRWGA